MCAILVLVGLACMVALCKRLHHICAFAWVIIEVSSMELDFVSQVYMMMFAPLLTPIFWERPGNIPALTRLLVSYLSKAGQEIVSGGMLHAGLSMHPISPTTCPQQHVPLLHPTNNLSSNSWCWSTDSLSLKAPEYLCLNSLSAGSWRVHHFLSFRTACRALDVVFDIGGIRSYPLLRCAKWAQWWHMCFGQRVSHLLLLPLHSCRALDPHAGCVPEANRQQSQRRVWLHAVEGHHRALAAVSLPAVHAPNLATAVHAVTGVSMLTTGLTQLRPPCCWRLGHTQRTHSRVQM